MLSFNLECGISTVGSKARWALRMRVSMSAIGSVIQLPTGFRYTGNEAGQGGFAKRQARTSELAQKAVTPATDAAAVDHASGTGVAGQLREPGIVLLRLQFRAQRREFLDGVYFFLVAFFPGCLCHIIIYFRRTASPSVSTNPAPHHQT